MQRSFFAKPCWVLYTVVSCLPGVLSAQDTHFDPNGTMPSTYTIELRNGLMVAFTPTFEILPGTAPKLPANGLKPFEMPMMPAESAGD